MLQKALYRLAILIAALNLCSVIDAGTLSFSGYTWNARNGRGGPGPNHWNSENAYVDGRGYLHLKITQVNGQWSCAEVTLTESLGFGTYQFQLIGRPDKFDRNVVLGMFNYGGADGINEIDIEDGQFGRANANRGNFTVYPSKRLSGYENATTTYPLSLSGTSLTQRFHWTSSQILFQSLHGHHDDNTNEFSRWLFQPKNAKDYIPQTALPIHINLWLARGNAPTDGKPVEIIISSFKLTPGIRPKN
jgi:hypothetical protein